MKLETKSRLLQAAAVLTTAFLLTATRPALAQEYGAPPSFTPQQLDDLVARIALYPDPLLAQVFAAASFPDQIADAARWADQYRNLRGDELAAEMAEANLPFDPAVQALIPFPAVLDMLAQNLNWTSALGNAVLADREEVMDAVQRMRRAAEQFGYLQSSAQMRVVNEGPEIEIVPANPELIYVPVYDPYVVYAPPRSGFFIGAAIGFGPCYSIGAFGDWGWGGGFNWYNHGIIVNRVAWGRTWHNREVYVHNYGNWDRGAWRNSVVNNRTFYHTDDANRNRNTFSNPGGFYRDTRPNAVYQNRPVQPAPVVQNRPYERNNGPQVTNNYRPAQMPYQNRSVERNTFSQPRTEFRPAPQMQPRQSFSAPRANEAPQFYRSGRR